MKILAKKIFNLSNKFMINESSLFSAILFLTIFPKLGFQSFSLTLNSILFIILFPLIILQILKLKIPIFKDFLLLLFAFMVISCLLSLIINGINYQNIFNVLKYFEILVYLLIYINAKYLIDVETINHNKTINIIKFIMLIFLYLFVVKIFEIKTYLNQLNFDLLLSDYNLKLNGFNDFTFDISKFTLITKGTTSTNLSYVFCFINIFVLVALFKIKNYSKILLIIMNFIFLCYSILVFHNTIYVTLVPLFIAAFTYLLYLLKFKHKFSLLILYSILTFLVYLNIADLGFLNKITNVLESAVTLENPRIKIWVSGVSLLATDNLKFMFGIISPERYIGFDFFESLFLDVFIKFGFIHLLLITALLAYLFSKVFLNFNIKEPNLRYYYLVLLFLTPSIIINNMVNSNMIFSELFAPIFFHIFGVLNNNTQNYEN